MKFSLYPGWKFWGFICCLFLLGGCQATKNPEGLMVKIERVVSGQTLEWVDTNKQPPLLERVRLIGIDAPSVRQQPWGYEAKKLLEQTIGKMSDRQFVLEPVLLESDVETVDRFGRRLAYVWKNGVLVNEQLVKEGYALCVRRSALGGSASRSPNHKYDTRLVRAQEYARIMGKGIWNPENPMRMTPAEFQHQNE